jgi:hypothetical protein
MDVRKEVTMSDDRDTLIRARAHELWEQAGCPDGQAVEHWLNAERELFGDDSDYTEADSSGSHADASPTKRAPAAR